MNPTILPPDDPRAPKYWMHETTGILKPVVNAYLKGERIDRIQIAIMRKYLEQWFDSPVWAPGWGAESAAAMFKLEALRRQVHAIQSREDIEAVLRDALDLGIDPL